MQSQQVYLVALTTCFYLLAISIWKITARLVTSVKNFIPENLQPNETTRTQTISLWYTGRAWMSQSAVLSFPALYLYTRYLLTGVGFSQGNLPDYPLWCVAHTIFCFSYIPTNKPVIRTYLHLELIGTLLAMNLGFDSLCTILDHYHITPIILISTLLGHVVPDGYCYLHLYHPSLRIPFGLLYSKRPQLQHLPNIQTYAYGYIATVNNCNIHLEPSPWPTSLFYPGHWRVGALSYTTNTKKDVLKLIDQTSRRPMMRIQTKEPATVKVSVPCPDPRSGNIVRLLGDTNHPLQPADPILLPGRNPNLTERRCTTSFYFYYSAPRAPTCITRKVHRQYLYLYWQYILLTSRLQPLLYELPRTSLTDPNVPEPVIYELPWDEYCSAYLDYLRDISAHFSLLLSEHVLFGSSEE